MVEIKRIDGDREVNKKCETLTLLVNGKSLTLTQEFGELRIHAHGDFIQVKPCCAIEILVSSFDT